MPASDSVEVVVLAAGSSSRLGRPKQLLDFGGRPLLTHCLETALSLQLPVSVVLGFEAEQMSKAVPSAVRQVDCQNWAAGMGASLKAAFLSLAPSTTGLLCLLCDQPFVTSLHLSRLLDRFDHQPLDVVVTHYEADAFGPPVLLSRTLESRVAAMPDQFGAKQLFDPFGSRTARVTFPLAAVDVDTEEAWEQAQSLAKRANHSR
jgi:molybdenum cofactor cytidylyltransferase